MIRELAEGEMTMMLATHELSFARDITHRVCFLEEGTPEQREPRTPRFPQRILDAGRL